MTDPIYILSVPSRSLKAIGFSSTKKKHGTNLLFQLCLSKSQYSKTQPCSPQINACSFLSHQNLPPLEPASVFHSFINHLPDMPISGSSNSAANKDMMAKI